MAINRYTKPTQVQLAPLPYEGMLNRAAQAVARKESMEYQDKVRQEQFERDDMLRAHQANLLANQAQGEAFGTIAAYDVDKANQDDYQNFLNQARERLDNIDEDAYTPEGIKNIYAEIASITNDPKLNYWKYDKAQKDLARSYIAENKDKLRDWEIEDIYRKMESPTISINEQGQEEYNPFTFEGVGQRMDWTSRLAALAKNILPEETTRVLFDEAGNPIMERMTSILKNKDIVNKLVAAAQSDPMLMDEAESFIDYAERQAGVKFTDEERREALGEYVRQRASGLGGIFERRKVAEDVVRKGKSGSGSGDGSYKPIMEGQSFEQIVQPLVEGEREELSGNISALDQEIQNTTKLLNDIKQGGNAYSPAQQKMAEQKIARLKTQKDNLDQIQSYVMENYDKMSTTFSDDFKKNISKNLDNYFRNNRAYYYITDDADNKVLAGSPLSQGASYFVPGKNAEGKRINYATKLQEVLPETQAEIRSQIDELQDVMIAKLRNGDYGPERDPSGVGGAAYNMESEYMNGVSQILERYGMAPLPPAKMGTQDVRKYYLDMDDAYDQAFDKFVSDAELTYQGATIEAVNQPTLQKQMKADFRDPDVSKIENLNFEFLSGNNVVPDMKTLEEKLAKSKENGFRLELVPDAMSMDKYSRPLSAPRAYLTYKVKQNGKDSGTIRVSSLLGKNSEEAKFLMDVEQTAPEAFTRAGEIPKKTFNSASPQGKVFLSTMMSQAAQSYHPRLGNDHVHTDGKTYKKRRYPFNIGDKKFTYTILSRPSEVDPNKYSFRILNNEGEVMADSPEALFTKISLLAYKQLNIK